MRFRALLFCLILGLLAGCQEEELPDPEGNEPVFGVEGTIDNQQRNIQAGKQDYFMHTFFTKDSNNQFYLSGQFGEPECKDCPESLKIQLPAFRSAKGKLNLEEAFREGPRTYYSPKRMKKVQFEAIRDDRSTGTYLWDFGNRKSSIKKNPTQFYNNSGRDTFTTSLTINYDNGDCIATTSRQIKLGAEQCKTNYRVKPVNQTEVIFESETPNLSRPLTYRWLHGETLISKVAHPTYDFQKPGVYQVCLKVTGASGCTAKRCQRVDVFSGGCNANFSYNVGSDSSLVDLDYINIAWRDGQGKLYKTGQREQPDRSYFRVLSSEPYQENRNSQPTYRLKVEFDCVVYASDGSTKRLEDFKGTIAVAYPENR